MNWLRSFFSETTRDGRQFNATPNLLFWTILAFFAVFLLWAAFAKIDQTVRGMGRIIPQGELQTVSNLEGGILETILVQSGDDVRRGEPLMVLNQLLAQAELGSTEAAVFALQARIARLIGELGGNSPAFPSANNALDSQQVDVERGLFRNRQSELQSALRAGQARLSQAESLVDETIAMRAAKRRILARDREKLELVRPLVEQGIEPRISLLELQSAVDIAQSEVAAADQSVLRSQAGITEAQAALAQISTNWRSSAASDLALTRADLQARSPAIPALSDRVGRTTVRAPVSGKVNRLLINTIGAAVRPSEALVELVPSSQTLLVEARIRPQDIAFVALGQKARVAITAYDRSVYGTLDGEVIGISPDVVADENTGENFYIVRISVPDADADGSTSGKYRIGSGMVAEVDLLGDKRTVLQYLLSPLIETQSRAFREQ